MYLRKLFKSKTQVYYIIKIQLEDPNKSNIISYIYSLLTKYNINLSVEQISLYIKTRWNKLITNKINERAKIMSLNKSNKLRKLHHLNKFKKSIKLEKYLTKLQQSDAIVKFKLRIRMTNLKNNFRGKFPITITEYAFTNHMMKNIYSALVHNLVHYIKSTKLQIVIKYLKMT